jgi:hypothetical protein
MSIRIRMTAIGGYFELELREGEEYHKNAIRLNTGRNALELILKIKQFRKVYIPYYTCDVILEPFVKLRIDHEFYYIDENLEPQFDYKCIKKNEGFLYINYFGLKDSFVTKLSLNCRNLIIDNSQAFFAQPNAGIPTFYSCRKFFGVPDGAYLYLDGVDTTNFGTDISLDRISHLLKRIEYGANEGFDDFRKSENQLSGQPILLMSNLTKSILKNIDYEIVKKTRLENYLFLTNHLSGLNSLKLPLEEKSVPMIYPLFSERLELKNRLLENMIFVATYWKHEINWVPTGNVEDYFAKQLIPIPIDQRYKQEQLETILKIIEQTDG